MTCRILVGCEESQVLTAAFRAAGFEAYSCDVVPTRGNPDWHYQADVIDVLAFESWSLVVLHPPCTALALSGNRWYGRGTPGYSERIKAIGWTAGLWYLAGRHSERVALENPTGVIFPAIGAPVTWVQPWEHGHGETKKTGFALRNLPPLVPSNVVEGRESRVHNMPPGPNRARDRSKTYSGIAAAIVDQWGPLL